MPLRMIRRMCFWVVGDHLPHPLVPWCPYVLKKLSSRWNAEQNNAFCAMGAAWWTFCKYVVKHMLRTTLCQNTHWEFQFRVQHVHNKSQKHASEVKDVKHTSWYATHAMQYMKTYMVTNWTYGAQHTSNTLGNCTSETKRVKNTLWNEASEVKCVRNTLRMMHIKFNMLNTHYQIQASRSESESGSPGRSQGQGLNQNMYMVMVAPMESFTRSLDPQL